MDISIFGFKLNLEILILIGVVYLILVSHTVCGCCNMGKIMEGFTEMATDMTTSMDDEMATSMNDEMATSMMDDSETDKDKKMMAKKTMPTQEVAGSVAPGQANSTPAATTAKEGFAGANINYGESSVYDLSSDPMINTSSWNAPNMTVVPGQPLSEGVKKFLAREPQPVPLPEGEMLMFANTPFKPECCPNTYSNSSGCACMTSNQYNYLITRSGNNVPYSEY
jgi:hypothetical protein